MKNIASHTASDQSDTEFKSEDVVIQDILKKTLHDMRESSDSIDFISQSETSFKHIISVDEDADQFMIALNL
ncbi:hypothetical protein LOZ53_005221 [Ophidiomyces ophidiicola]|nr:hypothetical protein LOZ53_005221 [Ophidiomyces ophidiicola]KAI1995949.1 hypothetical protein LOZ54_000440 [Ophidiomyces ophidiicola]